MHHLGMLENVLVAMEIDDLIPSWSISESGSKVTATIRWDKNRFQNHGPRGHLKTRSRFEKLKVKVKRSALMGQQYMRKCNRCCKRKQRTNKQAVCSKAVADSLSQNVPSKESVFVPTLPLKECNTTMKASVCSPESEAAIALYDPRVGTNPLTGIAYLNLQIIQVGFVQHVHTSGSRTLTFQGVSFYFFWFLFVGVFLISVGISYHQFYMLKAT